MVFTRGQKRKFEEGVDSNVNVNDNDNVNDNSNEDLNKRQGTFNMIIKRKKTSKTQTENVNEMESKIETSDESEIETSNESENETSTKTTAQNLETIIKTSLANLVSKFTKNEKTSDEPKDELKDEPKDEYDKYLQEGIETVKYRISNHNSYQFISLNRNNCTELYANDYKDN